MEGSVKTVGDLIAELQKHDPATRIVVPGFDEAGYSDIFAIEPVRIGAVAGNHCFEYDDCADGTPALCLR